MSAPSRDNQIGKSAEIGWTDEEYFYGLWPSEIERLRGLPATDWPAFFKMHCVLLHRDYGPPPVIRDDNFWRERCGHRTIGAWHRCRDRMIAARVATLDEFGGISSPWAERDWERRNRVSRRNSANGKLGGRPREASPTSASRPASHAYRANEVMVTSDNCLRFQLPSKAIAYRAPSDLDEDRNLDSNSPPLIPQITGSDWQEKSGYSDEYRIDDKKLRQDNSTAVPSHALRRLLSKERSGG